MSSSSTTWRRSSMCRTTWAPTRVPTFESSLSKIVTTRKPWSAKISEEAIALPRCPAPISAMLCWPAVLQDLADLGHERLDVVADAALAELAETGEVPPDLGRVDVRVVRELLGGDRLLAHLLGLREHLQVSDRRAATPSERRSPAVPTPPELVWSAPPPECPCVIGVTLDAHARAPPAESIRRSPRLRG